MTTSYNGWSASPNLKIKPLVVAGESFSPGVRDHNGVYTVLKYVAEQVHARVEPVVQSSWHQADDWGFSYRANANNPNSLSNHSSGTAIDYNATRHPNGVAVSRNFTSAQVAEIHKILKEVNNTVRWGGDYNSTVDAMHFEINASEAAVNAAALKVSKPTEWPDYADDSEQVKEVQRSLNTLSYVKPKLVVDGIYGPATKKAVMQFEKKYKGLKADGLFGNKSWTVFKKLFNKEKK